MVSVLIITKNEAQDLPGCLESLKGFDDVHVFDSFSTDDTIKIAQNSGAKVEQRIFDGYASQRNAALSGLPFKHPWVLLLDADERITSELADEIKLKIATVEFAIDGFRIRRKDFLFDTWLKRAQITPYYVRLVRHEKAKYHREVNEVMEVEGEVADLKSYFHHFPFSKGFDHWLAKHNTYSSMEADRWIEEHEGDFRFSLRKAFFSKDFSEKRYHQKGLFYKLPGRPLLKWFYITIWKRAFMDGRAGITYATLQSIYEYFIVIKTKDKLRKIKKQ